MAGATTTKKLEACPNRKAHTEGPKDYLAWHEWADRKRKTHDQERCPGCDLFVILKRKVPDA